MRKTLIWALACAMAMAVQGTGARVQAQEEPLPAKADIPEQFSTVICPDEGKGRTMLRDYYAADASGNGTDIKKFFAGTEATGCVQDGGPLIIDRVLVRRKLERLTDETYILYQGRRVKDGKPSGGVVIGIVHEEGNNKAPRSPLESWLELNAPGGTLEAGSKQTYVCPSAQAARAVVAAIHKEKSSAQQTKAKNAAVKANGCSKAKETFKVTALHESTTISLGMEAEEVWTALTATNAQGKTVGLVCDASQI